MFRSVRTVPMSPIPRARRLVIACLSLAVATVAFAHEGHDHADEGSDAVAAPVVASTSPGGVAGRSVVELTSERYEALVQSHGDHLDIWLDRYDTNEPVTGARVAVTLGEATEVVAEEETPGQYMVPITPLAPGASAALALSIQSAFGDDLLGGTLTDATPPPEPITSRIVHALEHSWRWLLGVLIAVGAAIVLRRLRARRRDRFALSVGVVLFAAIWALQPAPLGAHEVHEHADDTAPPLAATTGSQPARLADGSVFVPKPTQRLLEVRTVRVLEGDVSRSLRLAGELVGDPRASAVLQTLQG